MAPARADLPHEVQVWWQRVYLDSQFSASSSCSYHLPQEVSNKSRSHYCGLRVHSTPFERQTAWPFPYDLSSLQDVLHTMCGAHFLSWSPSLHPKYRGVIERLRDANVTSPPTKQNRSALFTQQLDILYYTCACTDWNWGTAWKADAMTLSCDLTLVTELVTRDW